MSTPNSELLTVSAMYCRFTRAGFPFIKPARSITVVDGVDLSVGRGEIVGLVGESGCGKSTLAKAVMGLGSYDVETMRFAGTDLAAPLDRRPRDLLRRIQYVFQDPLGALDPRRAVLYQVAEPLLIHDLDAGAKAQERARKALRDVNLGSEIDGKFPHELSGGQRQRVVIARALVLEPDLLICDEPVSALDVSIQAQIVNLLQDLRDARGIGILFISHDLGLVRHLCDRVAVMYLGRICESGPIDAVFDDSRHPYTRALIAAIPPDHPRDRRPLARLEGEPPRPSDPPAGCRFHPRCPLRQDTCGVEVPTLEPVSQENHFVACPVTKRSVSASC